MIPLLWLACFLLAFLTWRSVRLSGKAHSVDEWVAYWILAGLFAASTVAVYDATQRAIFP